MHLAFIGSRSQAGLQAPAVTVEVHLSSGLPGFHVVGLAESASREIRSRVRSAIVSSHLKWPDFNITVNLAPCEQAKQGTRYDLPIALGLLVASNQLPSSAMEKREFLGELGLDGSIRPSRGALSATLAATLDAHSMCVASAGAEDLACVQDSTIIAAPDLLSMCAILRADQPARVAPAPSSPPAAQFPDLSSIRGQPLLVRTLELAAAGGHHLLMTGPPGVGKTLAASTVPGLLPPLPPETQQQLWLLQDLTGGERLSNPPFRSPHHSSSIAALIGGTAKALPGEISMAHGGVLFLDELTEFPRAVLNQLRQPIEEGRICVSRAEHQHWYPAQFQLIAAMNPCPCGLAGSEDAQCRCTPDTIRRYRQGVSGPLMDRIDLHVTLNKPSTADLFSQPSAHDTSRGVRDRVRTARARQFDRQGCLNRDLSGEQAVALCQMTGRTREWLVNALERLGVSPRSAHRRLRVARTVADIEGVQCVTQDHLAHALALRETPPGGSAVKSF